ncbi:hypothetical protein D0S45_15200 [Marinifilum sp. JC120]|nr:hypothetical protein D0S45_15200 [Marinifilum sp. JC120]
MADAQKVSPSTVYNVQGSPDDYNYVLKGADLILVNKQTNEEQVFLFVGNIMSLDGKVNMEFSDGNSLQSQEIFSRSEMLDMDKQDEEAPEWEAVTEESTPSEEEGNSDDGNLKDGQLQPLQNAQAALVTDPTDDILKSQQRMFDDIDKFAQQDSLSSKAEPIEKIEAKENEHDDKKDDEKEKEKPIEEEKPDTTTDDQDDTNPAVNTNSGNITIELSQTDGESGIKETQDDGAGGTTEVYTKDGITNNTDFTLVGTADPGSKLEIFMNNKSMGTVTANATEDAHGNPAGYYEFPITGADSGKDDGFGSITHRFYAQLADSTVDPAPQSSTIEVEVDTTNPTLNETQINFTTQEGDVYYTNDDRPRLEGTGEKDTILTISYEGKDENGHTIASGTLDPTTITSSGSWSVLFPEDADGNGLGDGTYTFTIKGVDDAGNVLTTTQTIENYIIDTNFQTNATITLNDTSNSKGFGVDQTTETPPITNAKTLDLTIKDINSEAKDVTVMLVLDGGTTQDLGEATYDAGSGTWTYIVTEGVIPDNVNYKFMVKATDKAGNSFTPGSDLTVSIDREAPTNNLTIDLDADSDSAARDGLLGDDADNYTHGTPEGHAKGDGMLLLKGDNAGNQGKVNLYRVNAAGQYIDENGNVTDAENAVPINSTLITAGTDGSWNYDFDASSFGDETIYFRSAITDVAGNVKLSDVLNVHVDNVDPDKSTITAVSEYTDAHTTYVPGGTVTLTGVIRESGNDVVVTLYSCKEDGSGSLEISNTKQNSDVFKIVDNHDGTYTWTYAVGGLTHEEVRSYYVEVEDAAGNTESSKVFTFESDQQTKVPTIELDSSVEKGTDTGTVGDDITDFADGQGNMVNLKISGDSDATFKVYLVDNDGTHIAEVAESQVIKTGNVISFDASDYANDGTENVLRFVAVATDNTNNTATSEIYTVLLDDEAPELPTNGAIEITTETDATVISTATDTDFDETTYSNAKTLTLSGSFDDGIDLSGVTNAPTVSVPVVRIYDIDDSGNKKLVDTVTATKTATGFDWEYTIGNTLNANNNISDGDHKFSIEIEDAAGNVTAYPAGGETVDVHIDRDLPEITVALADDTNGDNMDTGLDGSDWITNVDSGLKIDVNITEDDPESISIVLNGTTYTRDLTDAEISAGKATIDLANPDGKTATAPTLNNGSDTSNSIEITVTDKAGNTSLPFNESLVIDTTDPTGNILLNDDDNAGDKTDTITTIPDPTLEGKTEAGAKIELKVLKLNSNGDLISTLDADGNVTNENNGVEYSATVYADANTGDWEVNPSTLAAGSYKVVATVTDVAGNTNMIDMGSDLVIAPKPDAPTVELIDDTTPLFFSTDDTKDDGITSDDTGQFTVTKSTGTYITVKYWEVNEAGVKIGAETIVEYKDAGDISAVEFDTDAITGGLDDGHYTFEFTATDSTSEISSNAKTVTIEVDSVDPALGLSYTKTGAAEAAEADNGVYLTNEDDPKITVTTDEGSQVRMMIFKGSANYPNLTDLEAFVAANKDALDDNVVNMNADGTWTAVPSFSSTPEEQDYRVVIVSEDKAGNLSAETIDFNHDNEDPETPAIQIYEDNGSALSGTDPVSGLQSTDDLTPLLKGKLDPDSDVETTITILDGDGNSKTLAESDLVIDADGYWSYNFSSDDKYDHIRGGTYTATITSTDGAGNSVNASTEFHIVQDLTSKPTIGLDETQYTGETDESTNTTYVSLEVLGAKDDTPANPMLTLTGTAIAYSTVDIYDIDGTKINTDPIAVLADGSWSYTFTDADNQSEKTHKYSVKCEGVKSTKDFTLVVDNGIVKPGIGLEKDTSTVENVANNDWVTSDPTITGTVEKDCTVEVKAERVFSLTAGEDKYIDANGDEQSVPADATIVEDADGNKYFVSSVTTDTVSSANTSDSSYSADLSALSDGQYRITVTTKDKAGNISTNTADEILVLDTGTDVPTVELAAASDTSFTEDTITLNNGTLDVYDDLPEAYKIKAQNGDFKVDKLTRDSTPELTGTAEAGALISIAIDGTAGVYTTHANEGGTWSLELNNTALSEGDHTITVTATDVAGNHKTSAELEIHVDSRLSTNPDITLTGDNDGHGVDGNPDIFYTGQENPNLRLTGEAGTAYVLYVQQENGTYIAVKSDFLNSNGIADYVVQDSDYPTDALSDGAHELVYKLVTVDEAGNAQTSDYTVDVDTADPAPATTIDFKTSDGSDTATIDLTNNTASIHTNNNKTDLVIHTADDTAEVQLWLKDKVTGNLTLKYTASVNNNEATMLLEEDTTTGSIDDGTETYVIKFIDDVGNQTDTSNVTLTMEVDTITPSATIDLSSGSDLGIDKDTREDGITSGESFTFEGKFKEDGTTDFSHTDYQITISAGGESWVYNSDGTQDNNIQNVQVNADGTYTFDFLDNDAGDALDNGTYTVEIKAIDDAGNVSEASNTTFEIKNIDLATPNMKVSGSGDIKFSSNENYLDPNTHNLDDYKTELIIHNTKGGTETTSVTQTDLKANGSITHFHEVSDGDDYAEVKVVDKYGNESKSSFHDLDKSDLNYSSEVGSKNEVTSFKATITGDIDGDGDADTITATINRGDNSITVTSDDVSGVTGDYDAGDGTWSLNFGRNLAGGNFDLHISGLDSEGNTISTSTTKDFNFTLKDMDDATPSNDYFESGSNQDFNGAKEGNGGDTADTTSTNNVVVETEVHQTHIEFDIA